MRIITRALTRKRILILFLSICSVFVFSAYAAEFDDSSDVEPTTPVTGYSIKLGTTSTPAPQSTPSIPSTTAQNPLPVANAGPNQEVFTGALVVLNASQSYDLEGTLTSYTWKQLSGPQIELLSHRTSHPSFSAGEVPASYVFQLTVRDNVGAVAIDLVTIQVRQNPQRVATPIPTVSFEPLVTPVPFSLTTFPVANILFVVLGGILILLVGIVIKVALKSEEP